MHYANEPLRVWVLFFFHGGHSLLRYVPANALISSSHVFACVPVHCVHARGRWVRYIVFNSPPCVCVCVCSPSLSPRACLLQKRAEKPAIGGPVVNLEHWFYIRSRLATDSWLFKCRCKGKGFHLLPHGCTHVHIHISTGSFIMHTHIQGSL